MGKSPLSGKSLREGHDVRSCRLVVKEIAALQRLREAFDVRGNCFRSLFASGSFFACDSGTISTRGSPNRVTRIVWRVLPTRWTIAEHLTRNSEKSISLIWVYSYHRQKAARVYKGTIAARGRPRACNVRNSRGRPAKDVVVKKVTIKTVA